MGPVLRRTEFWRTTGVVSAPLHSPGPKPSALANLFLQFHRLAHWWNSSVDNFVNTVSSKFNRVQHLAVPKLLISQEDQTALTWSPNQIQDIIETCWILLFRSNSI